MIFHMLFPGWVNLLVGRYVAVAALAVAVALGGSDRTI